MTSSRRRPGAKRGFRPRASRTTHRRHAVVVGGPERRCRPLPPHRVRAASRTRGRDGRTSTRRRSDGRVAARPRGSEPTPSPSYLPGSADLVLAEVKKLHERRPCGSRCADEGASPDCVPLGNQYRKRVARWGGDESTGNGPAGHHKQPGARLRASGVHGGAGGQGVHALVRGPSSHPTPDRATNLPPRSPPPSLPNALTSNAASHRRSTAQAHDR